ncbi:MAG: hypothetical protein M3Q84_04450, partial [Actinomycetota bacterium]|nr:hypothetical protein [Actinomycetota bacterium]
MPTSETRWTGPPEETPLPALQLAGVAELDIWWRRGVFALAEGDADGVGRGDPRPRPVPPVCQEPCANEGEHFLGLDL